MFNTIILMSVFSQVYEKIAYMLTNWENHRTQTVYDDSLIIKLFAFQFVNNYASLLYIAFFKVCLWHIVHNHQRLDYTIILMLCLLKNGAFSIAFKVVSDLIINLIPTGWQFIQQYPF